MYASERNTLSSIIQAQKRGDLLLAYDLAVQAIKKEKTTSPYAYQAVLALARCGAASRSLKAFSDWELDKQLDEDTLALKARLLKDIALKKNDNDSFSEAANHYLAAYEHTNGYFTAINAATLFLLAGETIQAKQLATIALELAKNKIENEPYYATATCAEAFLILNENESAQKNIILAANARGDDLLSGTRTKMQLNLICKYYGIDNSFLNALVPEKVFHYCGHILDQQYLSEELSISQQIKSIFDQHNTMLGYGSLAAGADILFAEEIIRRGGELNVFLPFAKDKFKEISVLPAGSNWEARFDNCLAKASSVFYVTDDTNHNDALFSYCSKIAMGKALILSRQLHLPVLQLAVWDGIESQGDAGTHADIRQWQAQGYPSIHIPFGMVRKYSKTKEANSIKTENQELRALLFCDVRGFSKLSNEALHWYTEIITPAFAKIINQYGSKVLYKNSWGDAIYLVTKSASDAAAIGFDFQSILNTTDQSSINIDEPLMLRVGLHFGPVFRASEPIIGKDSFFGTEVSRTARIEPVTPAGECFATETFAAMLALENKDSVSFDYVGIMPTAKNYGSFRMFHIRKTS